MFRLISLGIVFLFLNCSSSSDLRTPDNYSDSEKRSGLLLVPNQLPPPASIQSIQLYSKSKPNSPPIITLGKKERLILEFDELTSLSGQFTIRFEHFNQDWSPSNIPEAWFLEGFNELTISGGDINSLSKPNYFHYKTEFPKSDLKFLTSGNFMLHVYDYTSNTKLFSLPFFIVEQVGSLTSRSETIYNSGSNFTSIDQLFSVYEYPEEVDFPQFDLSFEFIQNRFWANSKSTQTFNTTTENRIRFYTPRNQSFSSSFDFIPLDLSDLNINLDKIEDWQPEYIPPKVILKRDILNFSSSTTTELTSRFGIPESFRDSRYAEVTFRFLAEGLDTRNSNIYLAGDFNSWRINEDSKLTFDKSDDIWTTKFLIKEGKYKYKYFMKVNSSDRPEALPVNDTSSDIEQEYISFVYFKDPQKNYQRLLAYNLFRSSN